MRQPVSAQTAQWFQTVHIRSNGYHRFLMVYNVLSQPQTLALLLSPQQPASASASIRLQPRPLLPRHGPVPPPPRAEAPFDRALQHPCSLALVPPSPQGAWQALTPRVVAFQIRSSAATALPGHARLAAPDAGGWHAPDAQIRPQRTPCFPSPISSSSGATLPLLPLLRLAGVVASFDSSLFSPFAFWCRRWGARRGGGIVEAAWRPWWPFPPTLVAVAFLAPAAPATCSTCSRRQQPVRLNAIKVRCITRAHVEVFYA